MLDLSIEIFNSPKVGKTGSPKVWRLENVLLTVGSWYFGGLPCCYKYPDKHLIAWWRCFVSIVLYADWHNSKIDIIVWFGGDSILSVLLFCDFTDYFVISPIGIIQRSGQLCGLMVTVFCHHLIYWLKYPIPAYFVKNIFCWVDAHHSDDGLAHNMVFWNIPPKTAIKRIVPVIAHHPVIAHFKGITVGFLTIYRNSISYGINFIMLVNFNSAAV